MTGGPRRRKVVRSAHFTDQAQARYPVGGSTEGRPSFELFEETLLRIVEEQLARAFDGLPEARPGVRVAATHASGFPFFPPMLFYARLRGGDVELIAVEVDEEYWDLIGRDPED